MRARQRARTAEVVSGLKTVVQARLRGIENERMDNRFESIEKAYQTFAARVRDIETGELPEELRQDLVGKLRGVGARIDRAPIGIQAHPPGEMRPLASQGLAAG